MTPETVNSVVSELSDEIYGLRCEIGSMELLIRDMMRVIHVSCHEQEAVSYKLYCNVRDRVSSTLGRKVV